ncbi:uncharacterized protein LOC132621559 isoform X1 [Lycium barbarum]|uniref:uncharacterized protein LOC132621559 isoform X1 n=1 Tax=Lycium barbarum TaxID=112863 RepID=UPI00293F42AE|nr:uncharacterized protein LOC132621559 isoform X1 [Lycium barbarum]
MASLSKKSMFNLSKAFPHRASSVFIGRQIWKGGYVGTAESSEQQSRHDDKKFYGTSNTDQTGSKVSEMADKAKEVKDKATETTQDAWKAIEDTAEKLKEKVVGDVDPENVQDEIVVEDEEELKKKLAKEPGGKPVDEDKGLDVNWRPIVEKKPQSS